MESFLFLTLFWTAILICVSSLDDLVVDFIYAWNKYKPLNYIDKIHARLSGHIAEKVPLTVVPDDTPRDPPTIGVFMANWQESNILAQAVQGNMGTIDYWPFKFYIGVYPNDLQTRKVALELAKSNAGIVEVITNPEYGPTSKGQMLNVMFSQVFADEESAPDLIVLHDSEDVIDPRSFRVYADNAELYDFIQIPVFSLESRLRSPTGATYMEEFAERHTREMVVRDARGVAIPSAGVGTCLSKKLITHYLRKRGHVLQSGCVTEDYILGNEAYAAGFKSTFYCSTDAMSISKSIVATREYFPKDFMASVKQKTRWVYGIVFEGTRILGWPGSVENKYFSYRDRKGAITNLLPPLALLLIILAYATTGFTSSREFPNLTSIIPFILILNTILIAFRYAIKVTSFQKIYGTYNLGGIALRWPVATVINAYATLRAWKSFLFESDFASKPIAWSKTEHEIPDDFEIPYDPHEVTHVSLLTPIEKVGRQSRPARGGPR